ncbi:MAG: choice-of-anchor B family protein [Flavobacteriales bacterium]|nr:choice-of-anchor B family protein [Flavobacteriales bacterium]MCB9447187.1 choice-of-anchor B family protein [Flavobacteriales bacterium]
MRLSHILLTCSLIVACLVPAMAQIDSNVTLLYHWNDTTIAGSASYNNRYNEIWGFTRNNREYAVIGSTQGTHIFDVTDAVNSVPVAFVKGAVSTNQIVHRDFHDYGNYLYMVSDEGESTLQIADISYLPDSVHVVYDSRNLFKRSHNIFIDSATVRLYVCSVTSTARGYKGLEVYSLQNPELPQLLKVYNDMGTVHDIYVRNDTGFCHNGYNGMVVMDFTDTSNFHALGSIDTYPDKGYNHSGWLSEDGKHYVMADENHGYRLKMLDVSDLSDIKVVATFGSGVDSMSMAHNPLIKGDYLYVAYYHDGFELYDISDPANPIKRGYYRTYSAGDHDSYRGAWGCYPFLPSGHVLVSDMQYGLFVLDVSQVISSTGDHPKPRSCRVYPNPTTGRLHVRFPEEMTGQVVRYEVYSMDGRRVLSGTTADENLSLEGLPESIYMLSLISGDVRFHTRISKINP